MATPSPRPVRPEGSHYGHIISSPRHHGYLFPAEERCQVDAAPIAPQMQSFYGREACNAKPPNSDAAILLGARVLVNVTATGDINGVTAAKRSCSFVRQPAGRPLQLPAPGMAWNLLEGWSRLGLRRARRNALLRSSYMQPEPQHRDKVRLHRWGLPNVVKDLILSFFACFLSLLLLVIYWNNNYLCAFPMAI
ncbi:hypothetical protein TcCL_NonESM10312 [Trypanosoma cruzi]|nr:hypothetical protein TcCL_NonESM10312 [Trypanosoma cruzi]